MIPNKVPTGNVCTYVYTVFMLRGQTLSLLQNVAHTKLEVHNHTRCLCMLQCYNFYSVELKRSTLVPAWQCHCEQSELHEVRPKSHINAYNSDSKSALEEEVHKYPDDAIYIQPKKQSAECWTLNGCGFTYVLEMGRSFQVLRLAQICSEFKNGK